MVLEGFPCDGLLAEPLHGVPSVHRHAERKHSRKLTPITFRKSLFEYIFMTFTATSRPRCFPFHTSVNPLLYNASPVRL